jgi:hypothetical protein
MSLVKSIECHNEKCFNDRLNELERKHQTGMITSAGDGINAKDLKISLTDSNVIFELVGKYGGGVYKRVKLPFGDFLPPYNQHYQFGFTGGAFQQSLPGPFKMPTPSFSSSSFSKPPPAY